MSDEQQEPSNVVNLPRPAYPDDYWIANQMNNLIETFGEEAVRNVWNQFYEGITNEQEQFQKQLRDMITVSK